MDEQLAKSPDDSSDVPGSSVLSAQQLFQSTMDFGDRSTEDGLRVAAECRALLTYLTVDGCTEPTSAAQGNISAAMGSSDESSRTFVFRGLQESAAHEGLLQFASRLLYLNASNG